MSSRNRTSGNPSIRGRRGKTCKRFEDSRYFREEKLQGESGPSHFRKEMSKEGMIEVHVLSIPLVGGEEENAWTSPKLYICVHSIYSKAVSQGI